MKTIAGDRITILLLIFVASHLSHLYGGSLAFAQNQFQEPASTELQDELKKTISNGKINSLIMIGYFDQIDSLKNVFQYPHNNLQATRFQGQIADTLLAQGFTERISPDGHEFNRGNHRIFLFNVNSSCPGLPKNAFGEEIRSTANLCQNQKNRIHQAIKLLDNLKLFDQFIFLGHSRLGNGLGVGPYEPYSTYRLLPRPLSSDSEVDDHLDRNIENRWTGGHLKKIALVDCRSQQHYAKIITQLGIVFFGPDEDVRWSPIDSRNIFLKYFQKYSEVFFKKSDSALGVPSEAPSTKETIE